MSGMSDALSAASLLLAALALVYSAWSASIQEAIDTPMGTTETQTKRRKDDIRGVRNRRAWPIAAACWLIVAGFFFRDVCIVMSVISCMRSPACGIADYDDIAAVFLLTQLLVLGMAIHMQGQVARLSKKL